MLRRIIQESPFLTLLAFAATYSLAVVSGMLLVAHGLARAPVVWH